VGTFRIGLHPLHSLHYYLLLREGGLIIDQPSRRYTDQPIPPHIQNRQLDRLHIPISGRAYKRYPRVRPWHMPQSIVDQTVDQNTPVAGAEFRR